MIDIALECTKSRIKPQKGSQLHKLLLEALAERRKWASNQPGHYRVTYSDYAKMLNILEHLL